MAMANVETLNTVAPKVIVTTCAHCFHTVGNEYSQFGGDYIVKHHTEFISDLLQSRYQDGMNYEFFFVGSSTITA